MTSQRSDNGEFVVLHRSRAESVTSGDTYGLWLLRCPKPQAPPPAKLAQRAVPIAVNPPEIRVADRLRRHQDLTECRRILRHGTQELNGDRVLPFKFTDLQRHTVRVAEAAGLEGFVFSERKFSREHGEESSIRLLPDYFNYVLTLLHGANRTQHARQFIRDLRSADTGDAQKYETLISFVREYVGDLQEKVKELDEAHWSLSARMYHVFTRPFHLEGWRQCNKIAPSSPTSGVLFRDLSVLDLSAMRDLSFNAVRWMGTFPIGQVGAKGAGGGSPFAARRFEVDPALGSQSEVAGAVKLAASLGIRTVFELVLNHTAIDADLLQHNPRLYVHRRGAPVDVANYYHHVSEQHGEFWIRYGGHIDETTGKRAYFRDTLQLDLTNRETRDLIMAQTKDLVRDYGVQAFRVDMAYKLRNQSFRSCWGRELENAENGQREFLEELITALKPVFPGVAFIAEAFSGWDELSEDGFDLIYGLEDMSLRGGGLHLGWHHAIATRDPAIIRAAIQRAEYLHWQSGGADMLAFWGQHDRPAFSKTLGEDWKWGAALLTLMRPGALNMLAGTEAEFEDPCEEDGKVVTFNRPTRIDWSGVTKEFGKFQIETLRHFQRLEQEWGTLTFELLPAPEGERWVGYVISSAQDRSQTARVVVLANPTSEAISVTVDRPDLGVAGVHLMLEPCGPRGLELVYLDAQVSEREIESPQRQSD